MLRKLILSGVLGLGLLVPTAALPQARAEDMPRGHSHHAHYDVMYRPDHHHPWRLYGTYDNGHEADHVAHHLRHEGYEVHIDVN